MIDINETLAAKAAKCLESIDLPEARIEFEVDCSTVKDLNHIRTFVDAVRALFADGYDVSIKVRNL